MHVRPIVFDLRATTVEAAEGGQGSAVALANGSGGADSELASVRAILGLGEVNGPAVEAALRQGATDETQVPDKTDYYRAMLRAAAPAQVPPSRRRLEELRRARESTEAKIREEEERRTSAEARVHSALPGTARAARLALGRPGTVSSRRAHESEAPDPSDEEAVEDLLFEEERALRRHQARIKELESLAAFRWKLDPDSLRFHREAIKLHTSLNSVPARVSSRRNDRPESAEAGVEGEADAEFGFTSSFLPSPLRRPPTSARSSSPRVVFEHVRPHSSRRGEPGAAEEAGADHWFMKPEEKRWVLGRELGTIRVSPFLGEPGGVALAEALRSTSAAASMRLAGTRASNDRERTNVVAGPRGGAGAGLEADERKVGDSDTLVGSSVPELRAPLSSGSPRVIVPTSEEWGGLGDRRVDGADEDLPTRIRDEVPNPRSVSILSRVEDFFPATNQTSHGSILTTTSYTVPLATRRGLKGVRVMGGQPVEVRPDVSMSHRDHVQQVRDERELAQEIERDRLHLEALQRADRQRRERLGIVSTARTGTAPTAHRVPSRPDGMPSEPLGVSWSDDGSRPSPGRSPPGGSESEGEGEGRAAGLDESSPSVKRSVMSTLPMTRVHEWLAAAGAVPSRDDRAQVMMKEEAMRASIQRSIARAAQASRTGRRDGPAPPPATVARGPAGPRTASVVSSMTRGAAPGSDGPAPSSPRRRALIPAGGARPPSAGSSLPGGAVVESDDLLLSVLERGKSSGGARELRSALRSRSGADGGSRNVTQQGSTFGGPSDDTSLRGFFVSSV